MYVIVCSANITNEIAEERSGVKTPIEEPFSLYLIKSNPHKQG